ncbi:MAG: cobalamin-binding protein [Proteobacteria bacterium]|nr:cobalamin-binding protein [Pseudomonadota bacterium]MBU1710127.1 cobalamin-binding protein [Pseudomonadota bacterium]
MNVSESYKTPGSFIVTVMFFVLVCCPPGLAATVIDQAGNRIEVPKEPQRIVSLAPSITEMIFALGQQDKLKGVTRFSDYPAAARDLPRVGSYIRLDIERILALQPDLCLAIKDGNPKYHIDKIKEFGIPVFAIDPQNLAEIMKTILEIGSLLGAEQRAGELVRDMQERIDRVKQKVDKVAGRPKVFFQVDIEPIISIGTNTFINELITLAGGVNAAAGAEVYPRFSWEEILMLQPQVVIMTSMAGEHTPEKLIATWKRWKDVPASRNDRLYVVDANLFGRPTSRLVEGLEVLADIIHPDEKGGGGD